MKKQARILCLFDYHVNTGFATVAHNITQQLRMHFEGSLLLDIVALNYHGQSFYVDEFTWVVSAKESARPHTVNFIDDFGTINFIDRLASAPGPYDGIFILLDLGVIAPLIPFLHMVQDQSRSKWGKTFKSILYFPVDGNMAPKVRNDFVSQYEKKYPGIDIPAWMKAEYIEQFKDIHFFDLLVTFTEYGRTEVLKHRPDIAAKLKVIPHGNNPGNFFQIEDRQAVQAFRESYFGKENAGKFIVANINRNQWRKDIPNTIFGFIEAKKLLADSIHHKKGMLLYLHMQPYDPQGWDLRRVLDQTELMEGRDYMFPPNYAADHGASVNLLNKIYNAVDVYLTTVTGGGWELGVTEAMACGVPVICPGHTSLKEISKNGERAFLLEDLFPVVSTRDNTVRYGTHIDEIADTIYDLVDNFDFSDFSHSFLANPKIFCGREYINTLSWENVCVKWIEYWQKIFF